MWYVVPRHHQVQIEEHVNKLEQGGPDDFSTSLLSLLHHESILFVRGVTRVLLHICIQIIHLKVFVPIQALQQFCFFRGSLSETT